jgi:hypothetical protein
VSAAKAEMPSHGFVAPTWESVQVEFDKLLEDPSEGGQVCVYFEVRSSKTPLLLRKTLPLFPLSMLRTHHAALCFG